MDLARLGLSADLQRQFSEHWPSGRILARVVARTADGALCVGDQGEVRASLAGKLRHQAQSDGALWPVVGDWVALRGEPTTGLVIEMVLERQGVLARPDPERPGLNEVLVANVDLVLVVMGLDQDFNLRRLERYLAMIRANGLRAAVALTKLDLIAASEPLVLAAERLATPALVHAVSAVSGEGVDRLRQSMSKSPTIALIGSSGVGKSTLVHLLTGAEVATQPTRLADGRGRHTTVGHHLHPRPDGGCLIDTPGLRSVALPAGSDLGDTFIEIGTLAGSCRFSDCRHQGEPGCAVQAAMAAGSLDSDRLSAYRKLEREARRQDAKQDPQLRAAERQQTRKWAREIRQELKLRPPRR